MDNIFTWLLQEIIVCLFVVLPGMPIVHKEDFWCNSNFRSSNISRKYPTAGQNGR